ncbi:MAG: hypothetical protein ACLP1Y_09080 [Candidatus Acidiferrales bacterium]
METGGCGMIEAWLSFAQVAALTGWKRRWLFKQISINAITSRLGALGHNGKPQREFLLSSLPEAAQVRHAEQTAQKPDALAIRENAALAETEPKRRPAAALQKTPRWRAIVPEKNVKLQVRVERRLEAIAPLIEYHRLATRREQNEMLGARGVRNFTELVDQAAVAADEKRRTLFRWLALFKSGGEPHLAGPVRQDKDKSRFFEEHGAAAAFVQNAYLTEGLNVFDIRDTLWRRWAEIGERGERPSYSTIRRYIRAIPKPIATLAREGEEKFTAKCGPHIIRAEQPVMKWWISDHRVHDVFVYNTAFAYEEPGKAYRLWLTAVYDWGSRKIMGCVWSPTPSSQTINSAVRMGVAQAGFPANLYWDNGKDFQAVARALTALLEAQQVSITKALPFSPRSKPIESYFTRWSFRFDRRWRPAYAGNKPSNCPPECREAQKLHSEWLAGKRDATPLPNDKDFILAALQFAVEYNDSPHESLDGRTPNQVFDEQHPESARKPVDRRLLDQLFWRRDERKVLAGGCIELDRLRYEPVEESFAALALTCGRAITVCRDPYDMGEAIALDAESGEFLGELRIQERVDQAPQGRVTQDAIRAGMRRARGLKRLCAQYGLAIEAMAANAGWKPEREALLDRARGIRTGTDGQGVLLRAAAPGAGSVGEGTLPRPVRELPALAPAFVSDGVRSDNFDISKLELED